MWPLLFWPMAFASAAIAPVRPENARKAIPPRAGRRWPAAATAEACKHVPNLAAVREALKG